MFHPFLLFLTIFFFPHFPQENAAINISFLCELFHGMLFIGVDSLECFEYCKNKTNTTTGAYISFSYDFFFVIIISFAGECEQKMSIKDENSKYMQLNFYLCADRDNNTQIGCCKVIMCVSRTWNKNNFTNVACKTQISLWFAFE